jgi:hypothetical protein
MDVLESLPQKKHHPVLIAFGVLVIILVGVVLWLSWIVAATGLVHVPVLTSLVYEKPEPVRVVTAGVPVETYVHSFVTREVVERVQAGRGALTDTSLVLTIPDNALTASARGASAQEVDLYFDLETSQVAVDPAIGFEIFLPVKDNEQDTAVKVSVWSEVDHSTLAVTITDVWVGNYHVPSWLVGVFAEKYLQHMILELNQELSKYVSISTLYFEEGTVTLAGDLNVELLELLK